MKKTILLAALIGATGAFADSYLYWMVNTADPSLDSNYSYVRVYDTASGKYLTPIYDGSFDYAYNEAGGQSGLSKETITDAADWGEGFFASLSGIETSSASFVVELFNESGTWLAQSAALSGSAAAGYIYNGGISAPPAVPWTAGSFAIPEPTSGLLMLLGIAGLALRRKREV